MYFNRNVQEKSFHCFSLCQVLAELKEYATEVDVDFVRKAVRAIGRCAIKVEVRNLVAFDKTKIILESFITEIFNWGRERD